VNSASRLPPKKNYFFLKILLVHNCLYLENLEKNLIALNESESEGIKWTQFRRISGVEVIKNFSGMSKF
jgi:hypothetical protein